MAREEDLAKGTRYNTCKVQGIKQSNYVFIAINPLLDIK